MITPKNLIVISGGSKGLGLGIVNSLLEQNYFVATFSRTKTKEIKQIENDKFRDHFYWQEIDASDFPALVKFVAYVNHHYGKVGVLINNVGIASEGIVTMLSPQTISKSLSVNLESVIRLTQACTKSMLLKREGIIINISSINGIRGQAGVSVYSACKSGLDGLTRSLARELGPRGIRINSIAPGYMLTDMTENLSEKKLQRIIHRTPLGRLGKIADVIGVISFLLSPEARFITGQTIVIDGGFTC